MDPAVVDLRDLDSHTTARPRGAVRLEVEEILHQPYLLPSRSRPLALVGGTVADVAPLVLALREAGHTDVRHFPGETWRDSLPFETGPSTRTHLWEPSSAVIRALEAHAPSIPGRTALDLACGSGRNAVYLALNGFEVTAIDRLPDALDKTRDLAQRSGVSLRTLERDLERPGALDGLAADLVVVVRYLERSLFPLLGRALNPGGLLVYETFTTARAAQGHPKNPRFLLHPGELRAAFEDLQILDSAEGFFEGAHLARLVSLRQPEGP